MKIQHISRPFRTLLLAATAFSAPLTASAQELKENVDIEGRYAPDVVKIDKIYTFPQRAVSRLPEYVPEYSLHGVATDFRPELMHLPATAWRASRSGKPQRGYIDLSLGSWLNASVSAGVNAIDTRLTSLSFHLQHNSSSLWKTDEDIRRFRYDETIGVNFRHSFGSYGTLSANADWHLRYFNYYNLATPAGAYAIPSLKQPDLPTQTLNDIHAAIGWESNATYTRNISYSANLSLRSFLYRSYSPQDNTPAFSADREHHIALDAMLATRPSGSRFAIDASFNALIYSASNFYNANSLPAPGNYGMIALRPAWMWDNGAVHVRIGAKADICLNAPGDNAHEHHSIFSAAPDVSAGWRSRSVSAYMRLGGGTSLNTMRSAAQLNYYMLPLATGLQPTYSPLDARIGFNFGPFGGFTAGIEGGYILARHTPQSIFSGNYIALDRAGDNLHGAIASASLQWEATRWLTAGGSFTWTPQHGSFGVFNGLDRPRYVADASVELRPWRQLMLQAQYALRAGRAMHDNFGPLPLRNISNLNFRAEYSPLENLHITFTALNLLNRRVETLPLLPDNGMEFYGGIALTF